MSENVVVFVFWESTYWEILSEDAEIENEFIVIIQKGKPHFESNIMILNQQA